MKLQFIAVLAVGVLLPASAVAQTKLEIASQCIEAIDEGEYVLAQQLAEDIKSWGNLFGTAVINAATACLNGATGEHWAYFATTGGFLSGNDARAEQEYIDGADERRASFEVRREIARCERDKALANLARVEEEIERAAEARGSEARAAVHEACTQLFDDDRPAALLSPVCYDVFVLHGLPGSDFRVNIDEWSEAVAALIKAEKAYANASGITQRDETSATNATCNDAH